MTYEICVTGHLDPERAEWFDGFTITHNPNGDTVLRGAVVDQTALHGLLVKIRDLNLNLVALRTVPQEREGTLRDGIQGR